MTREFDLNLGHHTAVRLYWNNGMRAGETCDATFTCAAVGCWILAIDRQVRGPLWPVAA